MQRKRLIDYAEDYLWELRRERGEGADIRNPASRVRRFAKWFDKTRRAPSALDVTYVRGYLFGVREQDWEGAAKCLANGSFNNALLHIKQFVRWLEDKGVIKSSARICAIENKEKTERENHRITRPQMRQMLANATNPWERWLLVLGLQTAGRVSEFRHPQWRHLLDDDRKIRWYRQKTRQYDELTAMPLLLREAMVWKTHLASQGYAITPDSYLVPARWGNQNSWCYVMNKPAGVQSMADAIKKHLLQFFTEGELFGEAAHVLRRSAARELYETFKEMGVPDPLRKVQTLLGHSSVTQTERYIGVRRDREERNELMDGLDWLAVSDVNVVRLEERRHGQG